RLVDGDRDVVLDLELQRLAKLVAGDGGQVDGADHDLLVGDAERDLLAFELVAVPEDPEGLHDRVGLHDLAITNRPGRQEHLPETVKREWATTSARELHSTDCARADVETDGGGGH